MKYEKRARLAHLPTPIEKLSKYSESLPGHNIYIKRDDYTGMEMSGNKIRKLEFCIGHAIANGYTSIMTTGGLGSNHCRATLLSSIKSGLTCHLMLRGSPNAPGDGNYFLMKMLAADIKYVSREEYKDNMKLMRQWADELEKQNGEKVLILPSGASNEIGCWGYIEAIREIKDFSSQTGIFFDTIACSIGSGGTYAGLWLGTNIYNYPSSIVGVNVCDTAEIFKKEITDLIHNFSKIYEYPLSKTVDPDIRGGYIGKGYAVSDPERMEFIHSFAKSEGIFLDPVYTGKGLYGLDQELKKGAFCNAKNILFIHTGGIFGLFESKKDFFVSSEF